MSDSTVATESLVRKFITLFGSHKFLDTLPLAAPTATWRISGIKEQNVAAGLKLFKEHIQGMLDVPKEILNWERLEIDVVDLLVDHKGEKAVLEVVAKIKDDDGVYRYTNDAAFIFEVKEGKIQSIREYMDFAPVAKYITEKREREGIE
ncbi:hypothetical protein CPB83DRAFT_902703 [Crepidotus variabilis]|uniref:SnoaL-like domain-containing protein n=1 Tax=Crepidotus variabilis TaxID=179855 RepID=A0A9P6JVL5_9AGAR|nr:hypothetical protein CPB83DRAFT_902703 [Crepidotus variabilis]